MTDNISDATSTEVAQLDLGTSSGCKRSMLAGQNIRLSGSRLPISTEHSSKAIIHQTYKYA